MIIMTIRDLFCVSVTGLELLYCEVCIVQGNGLQSWSSCKLLSLCKEKTDHKE